MNLFKLPSFTALAASALLFSAAGARGAATSLTATGWNVDILVGIGETTNNNAAVTASMDTGTALVPTGNVFAFYERGLNTLSQNTGLPAAGVVITSSNNSGNSFTLRPYVGNNGLLLDGGTKTLTLSSPTLMSQLVVYGTTGNGTAGQSVLVRYADGTTQSFSSTTGTVTSTNGPAPLGQDWFGGTTSTIGYNANGRINTTNGTFDQVGSNNPRIYEAVFNLTNITSPVTSVDFTSTGASTTHTVIYAISGAVLVPEPSGLALLGLGALGLLRRKRRAL